MCLHVYHSCDDRSCYMEACLSKKPSLSFLTLELERRAVTPTGDDGRQNKFGAELTRVPGLSVIEWPRVHNPSFGDCAYDIVNGRIGGWAGGGLEESCMRPFHIQNLTR